MESSTTEIWVDRIARWRASGERAETFSRREGFAASTLRWWSSKLKRDLAETPVSTAKPQLQLARVVRTPSAPVTQTAERHAIVLDVVDAGVRIGVEVDADPRTLAMVLEIVRAHAGARR